KLHLDQKVIQEELQNGTTLQSEDWFYAYVLGVCKWLLNYMMGHNYSVAVQLLPSYVYSVRSPDLDMVSLAFLLRPAVRPREDNSGLTRPRNKSAVHLVSEMTLACDLINKIAAIMNLDAMLNSDDELKRQMFEKSAALLAALRY